MFTRHSSGLNVVRGRVQALDAVRAIALLLMVIGHVANYSFLWRTSHFPYYVWDGASIFMVVSGIVVAQVNRVRIESSGFPAAAGRLARRAGFLYVVQVLLVAFATATAYFRPSPTSAEFLIPGLPSWQDAVLWDIVLSANPIYVNFLSSYVVILLAAIPALWLLSTRRYGLLALFAGVLYIVGLAWPQFFTLPNGPDGYAGFDNATWFVLFVSGLIVGWCWHERNLDSTLLSSKVVWSAVCLALAFLVFVIWDALPPEPGPFVDWFTDKDLMAPGRFVAAWAFFIPLYWVMRRLPSRRVGARTVTWCATLGKYPVDTIVILTVITIVSHGLLGVESPSRIAQVLAVITIVLAWLWARWRERGARPRSLSVRA